VTRYKLLNRRHVETYAVMSVEHCILSR